ncbi:MAG: CARDB domain-containing protein [Planctomycetaceae bacterium]
MQKFGQNAQVGGQIGAQFLKLENGQPVLNERALRRGIRQFANGKPLNEIVQNPGAGSGALQSLIANQSQGTGIREKIRNGQLSTILNPNGIGAVGSNPEIGNTALGGKRIRDIAGRLHEQDLSGAATSGTEAAIEQEAGLESPPAEHPPHIHGSHAIFPSHHHHIPQHATTVVDVLSQAAAGLGSVANLSPNVGGVTSVPATSATAAPAVVENSSAAEPSIPDAADASATVSANESVDIEPAELKLVDAGDIAAGRGPRYRLTARNLGKNEAPKFHVTLLVDGRELTENAFVITVESVGIAPGQSRSIDLQLPVEVLKMGTGADGKPASFETIVVILDSDEQVQETNEENNIVATRRDALKVTEPK